MKRLTHSQSVTLGVPLFATLVWLTALGLAAIPASVSADFNNPTRSTNIALNPGGSLLFNVNREAHSVTVFQVKGGGAALQNLQEIPVGRDPNCVAVRQGRAFVTNAHSGTVSVISLTGKFKVIKEIPVGAEPRGCVLTPDRKSLYVANHTAGTLSVINTQSLRVSDTIPVGGNPMALAIVGNTVFVTQFYARLIDDGDDQGEGFDDQKEGVVQAFRINNPGSITEIPLSPLPDSGFTADRSRFCNNTADPDPVNQVYCPDVNANPGDEVITKDPQAVFPNQLNSALTCGGKLYLPSIGAQPEPPQFFNTNIQALV
ncbi:MAG: YncE family protein, partial [Chromatiales bacterium]